MPIVAVGTDLVSLERIRQVWQRHPDRFLARHFTPAEVEYCLAHSDPVASLAARFAAKEAFQKCWTRPIGWRQVWVSREAGRPQLRLEPSLQQVLDQRGWVVHLSLSHERSMALAMVVLESGLPVVAPPAEP